MNNNIILEGGLGNRMRVAAAAYALSQRTGLSLRVLWTSQWGMRCRFDKLFRIVVGFPHFTLRDVRGFERMMFARPTLKNLHLPLLLQRLRYPRRIYAPQIWPLNQASFDYAAWFQQGDALLTAYRDFHPWTSQDLRTIFQPNDGVLHLVEERCAAFANRTIGIHIRRTDHQQAINESPLELFFEAIDREDPETIYLATDDEATKTAMRSRYGQRIITAVTQATRNNAEGIREALVEMLALSRTSHIYGSAGSTFAPIAACLGDIPITILQRDGRGTVDLLCKTL